MQGADGRDVMAFDDSAGASGGSWRRRPARRAPAAAARAVACAHIHPSAHRRTARASHRAPGGPGAPDDAPRAASDRLQ